MLLSPYMLQFVDGIICLACVFAVGFFIATHNPIMAILAAVIAVLSWNHLAGLSRNKD